MADVGRIVSGILKNERNNKKQKNEQRNIKHLDFNSKNMYLRVPPFPPKMMAA
jgi:hypothetical protein